MIPDWLGWLFTLVVAAGVVVLLFLPADYFGSPEGD